MYIVKVILITILAITLTSCKMHKKSTTENTEVETTQQVTKPVVVVKPKPIEEPGFVPVPIIEVNTTTPIVKPVPKPTVVIPVVRPTPIVKPKPITKPVPVVKPVVKPTPELITPPKPVVVPKPIVVIKPKPQPVVVPEPLPQPVETIDIPVQPAVSKDTTYDSGYIGALHPILVGLDYTCDGILKKTNGNGYFNCEAPPVNFYIGNLKIGYLDKLPEDFMVFPQDLVGQPRAAALHPDVIKLMLLLLSLDIDRDPVNGLYISYDTISKLNQVVTQGTELSSWSHTVLIETLDETVKEYYIYSIKETEDTLFGTMAANYKAPLQLE